MLALGGGSIPLTDLVLWLKADADVFHDDAGTDPATDGETVHKWLDQSGGGNNAAQSTDSACPTFQTNEVNSLPAVQFAANLRLVVADDPDLSLNTNLSIFCVLKHSGALSSVNTITSKDNGSTGAFTYLLDSSRRPQLDRPGAEAGIPATINLTESVFAVIACVVSGTSVSHFLNGAANGTDTLTTGTDVANDLLIAAFGDGSQNPLGNGLIAELLIYKAAKNSTDIDTINQALIDEYAVPPAPTPPDVPGLDWWLNADNIVGDDGDPVVDWQDWSGANKSYGQNTTLRQPTLKTALYNGHNAVRFGTNKCLVPDPDARTYGTTNTLWCICTPSSTSDYILRGDGSEGGPAFISAFLSRAFEYFYTSGGERATFDTSATGLHYLVLVRTDDVGNYVGYFDGTQVFSNAVNTGNDWNGRNCAIIGAFTAGLSAYTGDIVEIGHSNQALSGGDLTDLFSYLDTFL